MRRWMLALCVSTLVLWAGAANAVPFPTPQTVWTLDAPVAVSGGGLPTLTATLNPVATEVANLDDAVCLDSVSPTTCDIGNILTQDWLIFSISVTAGSLDEIGVGLVQLPPISGQMIGYFDDGSGTNPENTSNIDVSTDPVFHFSGLTGTSAILFVAYADGTFPFTPHPLFMSPDGSTNFMVSETGDAGNVTFTGTVNTTIDVVPEPGTAALMLLGLIGLARVGRSDR